MTGHEVEVKAVLFRGDDLEEMDRKISSMDTLIQENGGSFLKEVEQMDIYLSHHARDFSETDEAFRIRLEDVEGVKLTYKGPKISDRSKSRLEKEIELKVYDLDGLRKIFSHLGFNEVMSVIKTRRIFDLHGIEVDLDKVIGLGVFCELEISSDNIKEAEDRILAEMKKLGWTEFERRSYLELLLEKQF